MDSTKLTHIKQVLSQALEAQLKGDDNYDIDISGFNIRLNIKGAAWSGAVGKPLAKFILDLDKKIEDEMRKLGVSIPDSEHGIIALEVTHGSSDGWFKYTEGILKTWNKVKTKDKILLLTAILLALGVWKSTDIITAVNAPEIERIKSAEKTEFVKSVTSLADSNRELQQPLRSLLSKLDEKDTVRLPVTGNHVSKENAKETLEKGSRVKPVSQYIDGRYIVLDLKTRKPNEWQITLKFGDVIFPAKLELSHEDVSSLLAQFTAAHEKGSEIAPDLQVTAMVSEKGVKSATVIGLGIPRDKSMRLSQALAANK